MMLTLNIDTMEMEDEMEKKKGKGNANKNLNSLLKDWMKKENKKQKKKKKGDAKNFLDALGDFNFAKRAQKFVEQGLKGFPPKMGQNIPTTRDEVMPLSFSIAEEVGIKFDIYASNELKRLFVHEPGHGHFTAMESQDFSLFLSKAYYDTDLLPLLSDAVKRDVFSRLVSAPAIQVRPDLFDAQERFINVANGVVDLKTGELKKPDAKKYGFLNVIPFAYKPKYAAKKKMPKRFEEMLNRTFPEKKDRKRFLQCLAYLISNDRSKKVAFFWVGKPHTGKSTFQRLLARIVGKENISNVPLAKFSDRFSIASLFGKKINMAGETGKTTLKSLEVFKSVVGNDWIDAEFKGQDHFSFLAKAKNLFCGNSLPLLGREAAEKAVYDRFEFLEFQNPVPEKNQVPFYEDELLEKEGDKILTVLIRELRKFYKNGRQFTESHSSVALKEKFKQESKSQDGVEAFLKDCCTIDAKSDVPIHDICQVYRTYAKENGFEVLSDSEFIRELLSKGPFKRKRMHPSRNLQYRAIVGLSLKKE